MPTVICFPSLVCLHTFRVASPGSLHRVHPMTAWRLMTLLPLPSVPRAGIFAPRWVKRLRSSLLPGGDVAERPVAACAPPDGVGEQSAPWVKRGSHQRTFWLWRLSPCAPSCSRRFGHRLLASASGTGLVRLQSVGSAPTSFVSGHPTLDRATIQRRPLSPHGRAQTWLYEQHLQP